MAWGGYNLTPSWSDFTTGLKTLLPGGSEPDWSSGLEAAGSAVLGGGLAVATLPLNVVGAAVMAPSKDYSWSDLPTAIGNTYLLGGGNDFGGGPAPFTIGDAGLTALDHFTPDYFWTGDDRQERRQQPGTQGGSSPLLEDVKDAVENALPVGLLLLAAFAFAGDS